MKTPQFQNSLLCSPFESNFPTWSRKCKCNFLMISWEYYLPCNADFHAIFCGRLKLLTHLARNLNLGLIYLITTVIQDTKLTFSFNAHRLISNLGISGNLSEHFHGVGLGPLSKKLVL